MIFRSEWTAGVAAAALLMGCAAVTSAQAGGFSVREQSAHYQGMSFAGAATGQTLSSMAWNSAAAAAVKGFNTESSYSLVLPDSEITATGGVLTNFGGRESGNVGTVALVPASYANYQLTDKLFLGLGITSPFGFTTKPENINWAGSPIAVTSKVFSVDINPTIAYKLTPELTVGVGAQIEYFKIRLNSGDGTFPMALPGRETEGDDWGYGFTAGATWKPTPGTVIGVGYRSQVDIELEGTCKGGGLPTLAAGGLASPRCSASGAPPTDVTAKLTLPDMLTASFSQRITPQWTVLGTVEWTNWSNIGTHPIVNSSNVLEDRLTLNYKDGWFYSLGAEYAYSPALTLRAGGAWERAPISDRNRSVLLPDADRIWGSAGMSYKYSKDITFDLAYSHLFYEDGKINTVSQQLGTLITADTETSIDIVSAGLKYHVAGPREQLEPLK